MERRGKADWFPPGHGSFGIIRKVKRKQDGQILCRKEIHYMKMSQKEREQLHAEFSILSSLRHPNIVGYYHREHLKTSQDLHLYMEYCGNGDLGRVIKDLQAKRQYAEEGFVWSMLAQLVTALYRCHYGIDPPEVGSNVMGLGNTARPKTPTGGVMILHRDLKPENVFLGEDNSVKLGDFGLSKIMQSHDFASTYVGTPFYMSPEICAAERYTLKSDIWSLGCIIYELCAREPPFNAKSHLQLVQKIREGVVKRIPNVYSDELMKVIKDCLKTNPDSRPETAALLNLPIVKLMRKEKEVVELARLLKTKEELASQRLLQAESKAKGIEAEKAAMKVEIEASVRREWEVKARLEIDRQVAIEMDNLQKKFEAEVQDRVEKLRAPIKNLGTSVQDEVKNASISTNGESLGFGSADTTNITDFSEYSLDSPEPSKLCKKSARTPFGRAQTMFANTPMDVEMAEPSPIAIASLSLSPRRKGDTKAPITTGNIFMRAKTEMRHPVLYNSDSDGDDEIPTFPSPTRQKSSKNPFKAPARPPLISQRTAPVNKLGSHPNLFSGAKLTSESSRSDLRTVGSNSALKDKLASPNRRLSKIPSSSNLLSQENGGSTSPARKPSLTRKTSVVSLSASDDLSKMAMKNNMNKNAYLPTRGRTLVELQQARAGGRPLSNIDTADHGSDSAGGSPKGKRFADRMALRQEVAIWDPEKDDMPSPFKKALPKLTRSS